MSQLSIGKYQLTAFDLSVKPIMDTYLRELTLDTSDYTFAANYLWLNNGSGFYSIINDCFCFFLLQYGQLTMLLPPLGKPDNVLLAMHRCFELMQENNTDSSAIKMDYVDEYLLSAFLNDLEPDTQIFDLLEDYLVERTLVDYVYNAIDLIELNGSGFSNKRNEINKFKRTHENYIIQRLDVSLHRAGIISLLNKWIADRMRYMPKEDTERFLDGIYSERLAIKKMLDDYDYLQLTGIVILIDEDIKGFTVGEKINDKVASVIVEKTDFEVFGCAQFIFREFTKVLVADYNVKYINVGDDMGFENLKKVKMSYKPDRLIPKYTIYKKG